MKSTYRLWAILLCPVICAGCAQAPADTAPAPDASALVAQYQAAAQAVEQAQQLEIQSVFSQSRTVGGQVYTQRHAATAHYSGLGTERFTAQIEQQLQYGTYEADCTELYIDGTAYTQMQDAAFSAPMTASEFTDLQVPALLIDPSLYASVTAQTAEAGSTLIFSDATVLEHWANDCSDIHFTESSGTVVLDSQGTLLRSTYSARYICGDAVYTLEVTAALALGTGDVTVEAPSNAVELADLRAPKAILQAVGDVYTAQSITASYTDEIYNELLATARTQVSTLDLYGAGDGFMARQEHRVSVTDYTNTPSINTQLILFQNGICTSSVNGGTATEVPDMTAEQIRIACEDAILAPAMALKFIAGATVTEEDGALRFDFSGNEAFVQEQASKIFRLFQMMDPQDYALCTTNAASGYLCIDRHTGLLTAMGLALDRSYSVDSVTYALRYNLELEIDLSSATAYSTIKAAVG